MRIEQAENDEKTFIDVFELLIELHKEGGYAVLDTGDTSRTTYRILSEGTALVARDKDGKAIGTLGLTELKFWYAKDTYLQDVWFFVLPEHRGGNVGVELMRAARKIADEKNKILMVTVTNPDRRPKNTKMTIQSQNAGYIPVGYTIQAR
jgi:GNAT superfamily N-acetyltransferase